MCLPNLGFTYGGNSLNRERFSSHDHAKVAFGMANMGSHNAQRDVSDFGGVPFSVHMGNMCHRGADPRKKSNFHPSETTKRCIYQTDGSGRDSYITNNNGGLCADKVSGVRGTDLATLYGDSLRGYGKDTVSFGFNRGGKSVYLADKFISKNLSNEDPEFSTKYAK